MLIQKTKNTLSGSRKENETNTYFKNKKALQSLIFDTITAKKNHKHTNQIIPSLNYGEDETKKKLYPKKIVHLYLFVLKLYKNEMRNS